MNPELFFTRFLDEYAHFAPSKSKNNPIPVCVHQPNVQKPLISSATVHFPSEDEDVGSISYGWQG